MGLIKKAIWLSYDLGIGGDYPGLYKWLDNNEAVECGNSVAFFYFNIEKEQLDKLPQLVYKAIDGVVKLRSGDRLYIISRDKNLKVRGDFVWGKRKSNPWEGYGDSVDQGSEEGE